MAVTQTLTTSFLGELLLGVHDFRVTGGDTFKIALYSSAADLSKATTAYTATNEVSGTGYTAGGAALTSLGVTTSSTGVAHVSFSTASWASSSITARGALIYNSTPSAEGTSGALTNPAVCVLDFGSDKTSAATTFTVTFPTNDATSAIIRIKLQ